MGFLFRNKSNHIPANANFRITESGREKLQNFNGDVKTRILMALERDGSCDIEEISRTSGLSKGQVDRLLPGLLGGQYITYVNSAIMADD